MLQISLKVVEYERHNVSIDLSYNLELITSKKFLYKFEISRKI
jgi:hypothetical protein